MKLGNNAQIHHHHALPISGGKQDWYFTSVDSKESPSPLAADWTNEDHPESNACKQVAQQLENALREAKRQHLDCGEVLVPANLTFRIAQDVVRMSEREPCGLRGCVVYLALEERDLCRNIGVVDCDSDTVPTFELFLTLRQDSNSWLSLRHLIPNRLLKSLGRSTTLVVSEGYKLSKKKLYRSQN